MKQVIQEEDVATVTLSEAKFDMYYGVSDDESGRGFVYQDKSRSGQFRLLSSDGPYGNGWGDYMHQNLRELLKELLSSGFEVYEFDTHQKLFRWLSEE